MNTEIFAVPYEKKHILRNMLEIYLHDMSEFDDEEDRLELNKAGLYGYKYLDYYWTEAGRYPYLITVDGNLAGFALIRTLKQNDLTFEVAEFFILKKYRNSGVSKLFITELFSLHQGNWIINTPIKNIPAQRFWRKIANGESKGEFKEYLIEDGRRMEWAFKNIDLV